MSAQAPSFVRSEAWLLRRDSDDAVLQRHLDGTVIRVSGDDAPTVTRMLEALQTPRQASDVLPVRRERQGPGQARLWDMLTRYRVVREVRPWLDVAVRGQGALHRIAVALLRGRGWSLPALSIGQSLSPRGDVITDEIAVLRCGDGLVAALVADRPCAHCLQLRRLGRLAETEGPQDALVDEERPLDPDLGRALLAELACELQADRLPPGQGLIVHRGQGVARVRAIAHPDCRHCRARAEPCDATSVLTMLDADRTLSPESEHFDDLVDPHVGPLELHVVPPVSGRHPFGAPFIWGSVRLTRQSPTGTHAVSTWGGIYSMHADAQRTQLLAVSEGIERLAARGVRPDSGQDDTDSICQSVDLVTGSAHTLPFERVVVGLPGRLSMRQAPGEVFYSGCASHTSFAQAVLNGTLELIGRDAFMITWYRRRALPRLSWPGTPSPDVARMGAYLKDHGLSIEVFDMALDAPVFAVLVRVTARVGQGNWPEGGALLVAGVGFTAMAALAHACRVVCGQFVSLALYPDPAKNPLDAEAVGRISRNSPSWALTARYLDPAHRPAHDFLGSGTRSFESLPAITCHTRSQQLAALRAWFADSGYPWLVVRLTEETARLAGFEVVKVVSPDLIPLVPARADVPFQRARLTRAWPDATGQTMHPDPHPLF